MRILVLAPQVPWPLQQGTAIRNYHVLRLLSARHTVTLVAFGEAQTDVRPLEALGIHVLVVPSPPRRALAVRLLDLATTAVPDLARRLDSAAMTDRLRTLISAPPERSSAESDRPLPLFDVVQVEGLEMAVHGLMAANLLTAVGPVGHAPKLLYDAHNAEWVLQARAWEADRRRGPAGWPGAVYSWIQARKLRRFERRLLDRADLTVAVSEADAEALGMLSSTPPLRSSSPSTSDFKPRSKLGPPLVIANGVDTDAYAVADPAAIEPGLCVFTGKMDFRPNIDAVAWLCSEVWPLVRAGYPAARLAIVGRDPARRVLALAGEGLGVTVTGAVPEVQPWLARAAAVVVPLRVGGGTRLKVLEAMAAGKAIAATRLAVEGLHVVDGVDALLADQAEDLAAAILRLLADPGLRAELGMRARARAETEYRWPTILAPLMRLYDDWQRSVDTSNA